VDREQLGDPAAFVAARGAALLRLGWLLTGEREAAADLVQDALARTLPRWTSIATGAHEAYLRMAMRSIWIDSWRRRHGRTLDLVPEPPDSPTADAGLDGTALRLDVAAALARLAPRQRAVLVLRFYEDLTEVQTAEAMRCSVNTVKSQTRHALDRLRVLAPHLVLDHGPRLAAKEVG
jgi:RNA polymerase sigma-70 factor (sigma-E family)